MNFFIIFFIIGGAVRAGVLSQPAQEREPIRIDSSGKQTIKKSEISAASFASEAKPELARKGDKSSGSVDPQYANGFFFSTPFSEEWPLVRVNDL